MNRPARRGVLLNGWRNVSAHRPSDGDVVTDDLAIRLGFVAVDETREGEFEAGLADSSTLAFRVAYSVLRHREDAEDVAQEALSQ